MVTTSIDIARQMVNNYHLQADKESTHALADILVCKKYKKGEIIMEKNENIVFPQKNLNIENERLIYTVKEVATLLHSSPNYIYQLIEKGFLPALKFYTGRYWNIR